MEDDLNQLNSDQLAVLRTQLSRQRTRWAADRTLIAWLRTAISLIGFGLAMGKAGDYLDDSGILVDAFASMQLVGTAFIALAVLGLLGATIQLIRIQRRLASDGYGRVEPVPLGLTMAALVLLVGVLAGVALHL